MDRILLLLSASTVTFSLELKFLLCIAPKEWLISCIGSNNDKKEFMTEIFSVNKKFTTLISCAWIKEYEKRSFSSVFLALIGFCQ